MDDLRPTLIGGKYELLRELGSGGSATVYLARETGTERLVAVKIMRDDGGLVDARMRFSQEIRVMAKLVHPNIVPLFDTGAWSDRLYLVMPFIEGESLAARIGRLGKLPVDEVLGIARELCDALAYAHSRRIVHRDVKPSNVLIDASGHVMLSDFGVARWMELTGDDRPTQSGAGVPGTMAYASPEQAAGDAHLDERSDIFSLGCMLFEALTGELPFQGDNLRESLEKRLTSGAPSVRSLRPEVPEAVDAAIAKALAANPEERWALVSDFGRVVRTHELERQPVGRRSLQRRRVQRPLIVAAGAILATGLAWFGLRDLGTPVWGSEVVVPSRQAATTPAAARAFDDARMALARGQDRDALREFDAAVRLDPSFAEAALWRAQVAQWFTTSGPTNRWKDYATGVASTGTLRGRDSLHAAALAALAHARYGDSCDAFSRMVRADSSSFVGWLGLGECNRLDDVVVPDSASPSGWRLHGDWHAAQSAYRRALLLSRAGLPAPLFERALAVSVVRAEALRPGVDSMRTARFAAFPRLGSGRVGYTPFPLSDVMSGAKPVLDSSFSEALARERQYRLEMAEVQAERDSASSRAHEVVAEILELRGQVNTGDGLGRSAERSVSRAKALAPDQEARIRLSATETRLLLKAGRYEAARHLADSVATHSVAQSADQARWLAGLATVSGLSKHAERFLAQSLSTEERQRIEFGEALSPPLVNAIAGLYTAVDFGRCDASVTADFRQVQLLVESQFDGTRIDRVQRSLLASALTRSLPCYQASGRPPPVDHPAWLPALARAALKADVHGVETEMDRIRGVRSAGRTAYVTFDAVLLEAWALATVGDTLGAMAHLDRAFAALPAATPGITRDVQQPAALVRSMQLRAQLAARTGNAPEGAIWRAAAILWPGSGKAPHQ